MKVASLPQEPESKVGKILSESTQRAVIILVLSMLLSAAVLDLELFIVRMPPYPLGLQILTESKDQGFYPAFEAYLDSFKNDDFPLL